MDESYDKAFSNSNHFVDYYNLSPNINENEFLSSTMLEDSDSTIPFTSSFTLPTKGEEIKEERSFTNDIFGNNVLQNSINNDYNNIEIYEDSTNASFIPTESSFILPAAEEEDDGFYIDDTFGNNVLQNSTNGIEIYNDNNLISSNYKNNDNSNNNNNYILKYINIYINIYNDNIKLYKLSADTLEIYFKFLFSSLTKYFDEIIEIIKEFKQKDDRKRMRRNYNPLLEYIASVYKQYENYIYNKIEEIEDYMLTIEKKLLKFSQILTQSIWFCCYSTFLPSSRGIEFYENYSMKQVFYNTTEKFQKYFAFIYAVLLNK